MNVEPEGQSVARRGVKGSAWRACAWFRTLGHRAERVLRYPSGLHIQVLTLPADCATQWHQSRFRDPSRRINSKSSRTFTSYFNSSRHHASRSQQRSRRRCLARGAPSPSYNFCHCGAIQSSPEALSLLSSIILYLSKTHLSSHQGTSPRNQWYQNSTPSPPSPNSSCTTFELNESPVEVQETHCARLINRYTRYTFQLLYIYPASVGQQRCTWTGPLDMHTYSTCNGRW